MLVSLLWAAGGAASTSDTVWRAYFWVRSPNGTRETKTRNKMRRTARGDANCAGAREGGGWDAALVRLSALSSRHARVQNAHIGSAAPLLVTRVGLHHNMSHVGSKCVDWTVILSKNSGTHGGQFLFFHPKYARCGDNVASNDPIMPRWANLEVVPVNMAGSGRVSPICFSRELGM